MRALRLDYQRRNRPAPWLGAALLVSAAAALAVTLDRYRDVEDQADAWQARAEAAERLVARAAAPRAGRAGPPSRELVSEVRHANEIVRQLALPWDGLFEAVESCDCGEVALLALDPDPKKAVVRIGAEARTLDAMLGYVAHLERQPALREVFLQSHQIRHQDPDRPVRFVVLAAWSVAR